MSTSLYSISFFCNFLIDWKVTVFNTILIIVITSQQLLFIAKATHVFARMGYQLFLATSKALNYVQVYGWNFISWFTVETKFS